MSEYGNDQTAEMPPPPAPSAPPSAPAVRRLVRDPYTRLGGVASGLSHYLGIDVSLVRLAFVLFTFFSGVGLLVYLLAWLVVPRAEHWPPVGGGQPLRSVSSRELGIGLAVMVVLAALFVNGGGLAQALVPVLLVIGGVWLLRQPPGSRIDAAPRPVGPPPAPTSGVGSPLTGTSTTGTSTTGTSGTWTSTTGTSGTGTDPTTPMPVAEPGSVTPGSPFSAPGAPQPADTVTDPTLRSPVPPPQPPPTPPVLPPAGAAPGGMAPGTPVPPRRRRRWRWLVVTLVLLFVVVPLVVIALVVGLLIGGGVDIGSGFRATYRPGTVEEIPSSIDHDSGEIVLDLSELDPAGFDEDDLVRVDIDLSVGQVRVLVPEGLPVDVDAELDLGDVQVFDISQDGVGPDVETGDDDPLVDLDIQLDLGQIIVERVEPVG
jgi:phage shock protein PspC (stress-responsive transcriptional regulator)